jgi:hypothetical protein
MALQTQTPDNELLRRVEQLAAEKSRCPDAKAECHKHAASLGIILVEAPEPSGDETRRHRAHPMA